MKAFISSFIFLLVISGLASCYTFTGASIEGKTIQIAPVENKSLNIVPSLSPTMTEKIRTRIVSQAGLAPINSENADYELVVVVTNYNVTIAGVQGSTAGNNSPVAQNRLTISISVDFKNKINKKNSFKQSFSRFRDFSANQLIQNVENALIGEISTELADDIFNKAFVNW